MTGLDKMRECVTDCLRAAGVHAVTAWSGEDKKRTDAAVVAVSLRGCRGGPGGFHAGGGFTRGGGVGRPGGGFGGGFRSGGGSFRAGGGSTRGGGAGRR